MLCLFWNGHVDTLETLDVPKAPCMAMKLHEGQSANATVAMHGGAGAFASIPRAAWFHNMLQKGS